MQNGRPRDGHIANIRRKTRLQYHYAIRHVVKENTRIRNKKLAEAVAENNDRFKLLFKYQYHQIVSSYHHIW